MRVPANKQKMHSERLLASFAEEEAAAVLATPCKSARRRRRRRSTHQDSLRDPSPEEADQREAEGTRCRSLRGCCGLGAAAQREGAACRRQGLCGCCGFGPVVGSSEAASVAVPCEGAAAAAAVGRILALPSQRHRLPWIFRGVRDQACLSVPLECCRAEIVAQSACLSLQLPTVANMLFPL